MSDSGIGHNEMPGDAGVPEVFYGGQYAPYQPVIAAAGPSQGLVGVPPFSHNLETFRNDVYSCLGYEHTPVAEKIIELLNEYVRLKAAGRLCDATRLATSPLLSRSSQEPSPHDEAPPDGFGAHVCKWRDCGLPLDMATKAIKTHILEYHGADVPVPPNEWETSRTKVVCQWRECKTSCLARSIPKHVTGVHLASNAVRCPVEGCNEWLSRGDALKRHNIHKHGQK